MTVARMLDLVAWGAGDWREAHARRLGQLFGTVIHHARVTLALPEAPFAIAVAVIGAPRLAALMFAAGATAGFLHGRLRAGPRAVSASVSITVPADDETPLAPPAVQLPAVQHPSSIRKLGTDNAAEADYRPRVAASAVPEEEDPVPPVRKAAGSSFI